MARPYINLVGNKYGRLEVLERCYYEKWKRMVWKCKCDCGKVTYADANELKRKGHGGKKSCGCYKKEILKKQSEIVKRGYKNIQGRFICAIEASAKYRNLECKITSKLLYKLWIKQKGKCALSGIKLTLPKNCQDTNYNASIDRINSDLGYISYNIQWVHRQINFMKQDMTDDEFIKFCKKVSNYQNKKKYSNS